MHAVDASLVEALPGVQVASVSEAPTVSPAADPAVTTTPDTATQVLNEYLASRQHTVQAQFAELQMQKALLTRQAQQQIQQIQKEAEEQIRQLDAEIVRTQQHLTELDGLKTAFQATRPSS